MDDAAFGRLIRALRHRRGWRRVDLAARAEVGLNTITTIEAGRLGRMQLATIRSVAVAFGMSVDWNVRGLGADADRVLDERHSALLGACAAWLTAIGWQTRAEVSYSVYGERGSVDLLAWHSPTSSLLVIEIKTELASVEATLRKLDEKVRLAPGMARRIGWRPASVARLLVLPNESTQHRRVAAHASVLDPAYPRRTRQVRAWCRAPAGSMAGLIFIEHPERARGGRSGGRRERIRPATRARPQVRPGSRQTFVRPTVTSARGGRNPPATSDRLVPPAE